MRSADWRVSSVPELRSILIDEKMEAPIKTRQFLESMIGAHNFGARHREMLQDGALNERLFAAAVAAGEMYWVSSDMAALALDASSDVPGFTPLLDLPSPSGFMVLEKPLPALQTQILTPEGRPVDVGLEVDVIAWATQGIGMKIDSFCRADRVPGPRADQTFFEPVRFYQNRTTVFHDFSDPSLQPDVLRLTSFLAAAGILMATPGVSTRTTVSPRTKAARKDAKKGRSGSVTVIDLHAPKHVPTGDIDETGRVYTHRWVVRGHWRNQPHGPSRSQRSVRWIPSYIKGPAGKPLRKTERVWAWRR